MSEKKLTVFNANIRAASVSIKMLTLEAKKVTLSVFRQIEEEHIIDLKTLMLRGIPWGHVNYHWGEMNRSELHVLWQKGTELRRSLVSFAHDRLYDAHEAFVNHNLKRYKEKVKSLSLVVNLAEGFSIDSGFPGPNLPIEDHPEGMFVLADLENWKRLTGTHIPKLVFEFPEKPMPPKEPIKPTYFYSPQYDIKSEQEVKAEHEKELAAYREAVSAYPVEQERYEGAYREWLQKVRRMIAGTREVMGRKADEIYDRHVAYVQKHNELVDALKQTEQLFIAL